MLIDEIRDLLGSVPLGFEWLEYLLAGVFLLFLVSSCVSIISSIFRWVGEK